MYALGSAIIVEIQQFLSQIANSLGTDLIFILTLVLELLLIAFFFIKSMFSYEARMVRMLNKLNRWLNKNQYIDANNLIEFNNLMKMSLMPKLFRYHWHQYMLYREHEPSYYMSPYNCIEKPLKTSSFRANIKNLTAINFCLAAVALIFSLIYSTVSVTFVGLGEALILPVLVILINYLFVIPLKARENSNLADFYQLFHYFDRAIDKAVTTMPDYVDFEVLFTRKEIRKGIPVLNEYLEKRARQEQEELEKARLNAVEHETFDFSTAGIDGSLVLDRAMKETETYLNFRQRTLSEIEQLESEIDSLKRNYENTQKDYQRKLQASKENVDRLRKQQEESTNRIESNYIKKQQQDEVKKQEQLEKDFDEATVRFNNETQALNTEITNRRTELEEKRKYVETAMLAEYQTFSSKVYDSVQNKVEEQTKDEKEMLVDMRDEINKKLDEAHDQIDAQNREIDSLKALLASNNIAIPNEFESEMLQKEAKKVRAGKKDEPIVEEPQPQVAETPQEPVYDEYGGYYDAEGYYRYANGTYYDPDGNYHDEFGGVYDKDGNYTPPAEQATEAQPAEEATSEEPVSEEAPGEEEEAPVEEVITESVETIERPKKKAGRPRKEKTEEAPKEPKKRGRPRKEVTEEVKAEPKKRGRPRKEKVEEPASEPKKRGRPKKQTEEKRETEAPKKRGRPRKTTEEKPAEEKRPRGRPRKEVTETVETQAEPKKRGRPRKETPEEVPQTEKRGRGRPRKEKTEEPVATPRKRGRPRKDETADEIQRLNAQIVEENIKLMQKQQELSNQINETISKLNATQAETPAENPENPQE